MTGSDIIKYIGHNIADSIEDEVFNAVLTMYVIDTELNKFVKFNGIYFDKDNEKKDIDIFKFDDSFGFRILQFHRDMHRYGNAKWNKAIATLNTEGEFNMDFLWDQEYADEIERNSKL